MSNSIQKFGIVEHFSINYFFSLDWHNSTDHHFSLKRISKNKPQDVDNYSFFDLMLHVAGKDKSDINEIINERWNIGNRKKESNWDYLNEVGHSQNIIYI